MLIFLTLLVILILIHVNNKNNDILICQCNQLCSSKQPTLQWPSRDKRSCRSPSHPLTPQVSFFSFSSWEMKLLEGLTPQVNFPLPIFSRYFSPYFSSCLFSSSDIKLHHTSSSSTREGKVMSPGSSVMETPSQSFASPQVSKFDLISWPKSDQQKYSTSSLIWFHPREVEQADVVVGGSSQVLKMNVTGS